MNLDEAKEKILDPSFLEFKLSEQVELFQSLEQSGAVFFLQSEMDKLLTFYISQGNVTKTIQILNFLKEKKSYDQIYSFYLFCCQYLLNTLTLNTFRMMRAACLALDQKNETKGFKDYKALTLKFYHFFGVEIDHLVNEKQFLTFCEKLIAFDQKSSDSLNPRYFSFKKSWLIKQIILFPKDTYTINYAILALYHGNQLVASHELYQYALNCNIKISFRVKRLALENQWEFERRYRLKELDDQTLLLSKISLDVPVEELLLASEKPFLRIEEYNKIVESYSEYRKEQTIEESSAARMLSSSFKEDTEKVNFFMENHAYDEALIVLRRVIPVVEKEFPGEPSSRDLNWYYLTLFALHAKKDYTEAIEFSATYSARWQLMGASAIDFYYLVAECNFALGHFKLALEYYNKVQVFTPNYRLTKKRLEEIEARK